MKQFYVFFIAFLLHHFTLYAQSVFPIYKDRPVWCMNTSCFGRPMPDYKIVMLADTMICGKRYTPLQVKDRIFYPGSTPTTYIDGFVRQERKKVYQLISECREILLYDFSLELGDTMRHEDFYDEDYADAVVVDIQYREANGQIKKVITLNYWEWRHLVYWVEGLGDLVHPISRIMCYSGYACEEFTNVNCISTKEGNIYGICEEDCGIRTAVTENSDLNVPITLFPNPVSVGGRVQLDYKNIHIDNLLIVNALGQIIHKENIPKNATAEQLLLNWIPNAPGFYWVMVETNSVGRQLVKLVVH